MPDNANLIEFSLVNQICYLKTSSSCTHMVAPDLTAFVENLCKNRSSLSVQMILSEVEYMDSTIMGTLLGIYQNCQESEETSFTLINPSEKAMAHLSTMGLHEVLQIEKNVEVPKNLEFGIIDEIMITTLGREKYVLKAHELLSELNDQNAVQFKLLISSLTADIERKKDKES